jgi:dipeptidyl aminopeptidase/acylaminoacyl peptidase
MRFSLLLLVASLTQAQFTLPQLRSYPFPNELTAAGPHMAWAVNEEGRRNIYVATAPDYAARRLTNYLQDDGQELTSVSVSADGKYVVFVRGGEHGSNWDVSVPVNPASMPTAFPVQIVSVPFAGGEAKVLAEGDQPEISPRGDLVLFVRQGGLYVVPIDGAKAAKPLFRARGNAGQAQWSPDGSSVAFVSNRGTHSYVGVYRDETTPILWLSPSTNRDSSPRWSPDGSEIAFLRQAPQGGEPQPLLTPEPNPWSIRVANAKTGESKQIWASGTGRRDAMPTTHGQANLQWAAKGRIVFVSYADGFPHLYSISQDGGPALQLTKGRYMNEYISLSQDKTFLLSSANTGPDALDIDRRHILRVPVDAAKPEVLTQGSGLEWTAVAISDGVACIAATPQKAPVVMVYRQGRAPQMAGPAGPSWPLVTPKQVIFKAPDGTAIHAQLFDKAPDKKKAAIVYIHGGPPRQMLLGWHYSDYYSNAYAMNQYLASRGFAVLAVNYRLGIGYGFEFHQALGAGTRGASEYQDIKAAGEYLKTLPNVDANRIGVYGGSYGGYLTALALARDSGLFAAGVDIHGVHHRFIGRNRGSAEGGYERAPDANEAREIAWKSSPVADVATWKSPVLLIHGDDDRNVEFIQTVDLTRRLEKHKVPYEELVIPDDTHHFLRHANWLKVGEATAEFFERKLLRSPNASTR